MNFENPNLLWLLILAIIPIVIYYLLRFRSLKVNWGANWVLERALEQLRKKVRLDQILLMALRILAIILLVLAFARPLAAPGDNVTNTGIHHVVVFDTSYSMAAGQTDDTRFDRARQTLRELVSTWGRGEVWSLLALGDEPRWVVDGQVISSTEQALEAVEALDVSESSASLPMAMEAVSERFPTGQIEVYLFTDDQANTWDGMMTATVPGQGEADVYWVRPDLAERANVAVTDVRPAVNRPLLGHPQRIAVSVQNFADRPLQDVVVDLLVDGARRADQAVSLLSGQRTTLHFDVTFEEAGSHIVSAQVEGDALRFDNAMPAAVDVARELRVGVLRAPDKQGKFESAWGFVETIARADKLAEAPGIEIDWQLIDQPLTSGALDEVDVVYIDGGTRVEPTLVNPLRAFVERGGGVVLGADPGISREAWNQLLYPAELMPAQLGPVRVEQVGGPRSQSLLARPVGHPALAAFEAEGGGDLSNAEFFVWYQPQQVDPDARVLVRYGDQTPWAIMQTWPLGRSILLSSGLAGTATNLFVREIYVPLVYRLFQLAGEGASFDRTVERGQPVRLKLGEQVDAVTFAARNAEPAPVQPQQGQAGLIAEVNQPELPTGAYSFLVLQPGQANRTEWYAIQGERTDSNLAPLPKALEEQVSERLAMQTAADWDQLDQLLAARRRGSEWHPWVMALLAVVLLSEMFIQRRFVMNRR